MIICSCNVVSHQEIETVVEELVRSDPNVVLTAGEVYRAIGVQPKCGTCLKSVIELIHTHRDTVLAGNVQVESSEN